jgi:hypothetical protein
MATSYTSLLGLALPVQGELSGTWGDVVNSYITNYVDAAVAGTQLISGSQTAVTLSVANGASLSQAAAGATGSAQYQIIRCSGNPASLLTITAPAASKVYLIINATSTSQSVKIVGTGPTTGVTIATGKGALVAWNGSDFVTIASNDASVITGVLAAANGGTGQSSYAVGDILYASTTTALSKLADVATGSAIISGGVGVAPSYGKIGLTTHVSGTLPIANGGTNSTATATAGGIGYGTGTAHAYTVAGTTGQVITSAGAGVPTWTTATNANTASAIVQRDASGNFSAGTITAALSGNATTATSATSATSATTATNLAGGAVGSIAYQSGVGATTFLADVATGNAVISGGVGIAPAYGKIGLTTHVSGTLPIANGGTNATATPTAGGAVYGTGTAYAITAAGTSGQVLTSNGASAPTWQAAAGAGVTTFSAGTTGFTPSTGTTGAVTLAGTLATTNGGTGQTSYTNGQLLIGNTTGNTLAKATLTAGTGITVTNGAGTITIASSGGGGTGSNLYLAVNFGGF